MSCEREEEGTNRSWSEKLKTANRGKKTRNQKRRRKANEKKGEKRRETFGENGELLANRSQTLYYLIPTYPRSKDGVKRTERVPAADKYRDIIILQLLYLYIYYIYINIIIVLIST